MINPSRKSNVYISEEKKTRENRFFWINKSIRKGSNLKINHTVNTSNFEIIIKFTAEQNTIF